MSLKLEIPLLVRFSDTDAMGVVWHGNYLKFFEDAREAFGEEYDLRYLDMYHNKYFTPIVKVDIQHKAPIYYGDNVKIVITMVPQRAAKLVFRYQVLNADNGAICAEGSTMQVFMDAETRALELNAPPFFEAWKAKWLK